MTDTRTLGELTTRAADLADRCEAAGALVAAAVLRGIAEDVEETIIRTAPPVEWPARPRGTERALRLVRPDPGRGRGTAGRSRARSAG
jgi:hypothetical protein